jgi:hypothetical protein
MVVRQLQPCSDVDDNQKGAAKNNRISSQGTSLSRWKVVEIVETLVSKRWSRPEMLNSLLPKGDGNNSLGNRIGASEPDSAMFTQKRTRTGAFYCPPPSVAQPFWLRSYNFFATVHLVSRSLNGSEKLA